MDMIALPLLMGSDPLETGLERLRAADTRAAVVSMPGEQFRLHMNRDFLQAIAIGKRTCAEMEGGEWVTFFKTTPSDQEKALDNAQTVFGIFANQVAATVTITTRNEWRARDIRDARKVCRCNGSPRHLYDSPPEQTGNRCPKGDGKLDCY